MLIAMSGDGKYGGARMIRQRQARKIPAAGDTFPDRGRDS
jgi:hypothetical protein